MEKDILVILMVAFGLFAIVMFVLFFIYLKKYYNSKHLEDDYKKDVDDYLKEENDLFKEEPKDNNTYENMNEEFITNNDSFDTSYQEDFIPIKKK